MNSAGTDRGADDVALGWVVLTMGDRPGMLAAAVDSILSVGGCSQVLVLCNGASGAEVSASLAADDRLSVIESRDNQGIPGGRDVGLHHLDPNIGLVGFLDDDAVVISPNLAAIVSRTFADSSVAAISLKIRDEQGRSSRRHIPRPGGGSADRGGAVATFLGGACVIRRSAYVSVGGYWPELWYGHEELDLAWRLAEGGWSLRYEASIEVVHPSADISRHADGWRLTGRNRVMVARRNLPLAVLVLHVGFWLVVGLLRAPGHCRRSYLAGWWTGWSAEVSRRPMRWATVWKLTRLGRPPVI